MTRKKSLKVLGRSLMPEILPDPTGAANSAAAAPRERVRARLRQISERAAAIAAAASLSAGCSGKTHGLDANTVGDGGTGAGRGGSGATGGTAGYVPTGGTAGYGVVDPLPWPSGTGGYGGIAGGPAGTGGSAGYAVVDPVPPPYICPSPDALALSVSAQWNNFTIDLFVQPAGSFTPSPGAGIPAPSPQITVQSVRVTGGISVVVVSGSQIRLSVTNGSWPPVVELSLSLVCAGPSGAVLYYEVGLRLDTSRPATAGTVFYQLIDGDADAGV